MSGPIALQEEISNLKNITQNMNIGYGKPKWKIIEIKG
jgi:hypothetical protein